MTHAEEVDRDAISALVISGVRQVLLQKGEPIPDTMEESTRLTGSDSNLDSLGLMTLVVDLEETLEEKHGVSVILADGRPLSEVNSSFATVRSLTDRICDLIEKDGNDRFS